MSEQQEPTSDQPTTEQTAPEQPTTGQEATGQGDAERQAEASEPSGGSGNADQGTQKKTKGRKQGGARKTRQVELTLTVSGTAEGEWQADLTHAGKKIVQGLPIAASSVSKAAGELHDDISEAIESVLSEARQQHEARLAELEAELQRVRKTLEELES
ncbi:hypothetical protein CDG81_20030 [Actinopolyspora erythraea]|uniref:Uncharacterized protein n=1 Tax=Actinopolyspora erythraea TaxID=414996 RepID=A0A099D8V0_9ACTN|nr:DUF6319 family protein [Actinopolyspora erythraea]ASU80177.1 hypothetical protein CDG81_20030 [Actinopolyspora erythraea]KGI82454.1 hypothetical protein IL38_04855 [Actinopolyspora erythraea]